MVKPIRGLVSAASNARPYASAIAEADRESRTGGGLALADGDRVPTERLGELLGLVSSRVMRPREDLLLYALGPGSDPEPVADALARRKAQGGRVLAILAGSRADRQPMERAFLARPGVELSDLAQVSSMRGPGARAVEDAIVGALGDEAVAAARRHPQIRRAVSEGLVRRAARRAAVVAALPLAPSHYLVLGTLQIGMVGGVAALHEEEIGAESVARALGILGLGAGWRALARSAGRAVPPLAPAVNAGVAYASTRALGELAQRHVSAGRSLLGRLPAPAKATADRIVQRLPGPLAVTGAREGSTG